MDATKVPLNARDQRVAHVRELAREAFAAHQIDQRLDVGLYRSWVCSRPSSGCYAFTITTTPGRLIVVGDVGDLIVERVSDMIPWCRGSVKDMSYFAQKVPAAIPTREYDPDVASEWLRESIEEARSERDGDPERLEKLLDLHADADNEHEFKMAIWESGVEDGCDFPDFSNWTHNFLWCREAVKWLLDHLDTSTTPTR